LHSRVCQNPFHSHQYAAGTKFLAGFEKQGTVFQSATSVNAFRADALRLDFRRRQSLRSGALNSTRVPAQSITPRQNLIYGTGIRNGCNPCRINEYTLLIYGKQGFRTLLFAPSEPSFRRRQDASR
jgi:hypothetical protein